MSFKNLKKKRSNLTDLASKLQKSSKNSNYEKDERYWYPERNKDGNGYAVIRFLPPTEGEDYSFVKTFRHGFKAKGGWFFADCPTTIGKDCPVCSSNTDLYTNLGKEKASRIVSGANGRKRKMQYVSNICVIKDPETPENEGKVFLFKYGSKIFEKLMGAVEPEFEDETAIDPFDMWNGANFTLKIRKVDGNVNYDTSKFGEVISLNDDDSVLEEIYKSQHSLNEIIAEDKFLSFDALAVKLNKALGTDTPNAPTESAEPAVLPQTPERSMESEDPTPQEDDKESEDTLNFFKDMAE